MSNQQSSSYKLVFEGLQDDSDETLRRVKSIFITDLALSIEDAQQALSEQPFTLKHADSKMSLEDLYSKLKLAGGEVLIVEASEAQPEQVVSKEAATDISEMSFEESSDEGLSTELVEDAGDLSALSLDDVLWADDEGNSEPKKEEEPAQKASAEDNDDFSLEISLDQEAESSSSIQTQVEIPEEAPVEDNSVDLSFGEEQPIADDELSFDDVSDTAPTPSEDTVPSNETESSLDLSFSDEGESPVAEAPSESVAEEQKQETDSELTFDLSFSEEEPTIAVAEPEQEIATDDGANSGLDLSFSDDEPTSTVEPEVNPPEEESTTGLDLSFGEDEPVAEAPQEMDLSTPEGSPEPKVEEAGVGLSFDEPEEAATPDPIAVKQEVEPEPTLDSGLSLDEPEPVEEEQSVAPTVELETEVPAQENSQVALETEDVEEPQEASPEQESQTEPTKEEIQASAQETAEEELEEEEYYEDDEEEEVEAIQADDPNEVYEITEVQEGKKKKKLPLDLIGALFVGAAILAFINLGGEEPEPAVDPLKLKVAMAKLKKERKAREAKKNAPPPPEISKISNSNQNDVRMLEWEITLMDLAPTKGKILMQYPEQAPLTDEQIVRGEVLIPYVNKVEIENLRFETGEDGTYLGSGNAKFYMSHAGKKQRFIGTSSVVVSWNEDKTLLRGQLKAWYGFEANPDLGEAVFITEESPKKYQMYVASELEYLKEDAASPTEQSEPAVEEGTVSGKEVEGE